MSLDQPILIETDRLTLRPLRLTDINDLFEYQSNMEIVRYIPWPVRTMEQVESAVMKVLSDCTNHLQDEGDSLVLGWDYHGKIIGQSNMTLISSPDKCADIGWVTHQDFHRSGFAFEATKALMTYAFKNFDINRIVANIDTRAVGSSLLAEKLGMRREGEFRKAKYFKGEWTDMWLYAILKNEFSLPQ